MGQWLLFLFLCWATLFGLSCGGSLGVRQRSVESCGPHPLIALATASRPFATSASSLNDLIRTVRGDPITWSEMQILLRRYDDCIRAGDGLHYKRSNKDKDQQQQQFSFASIVHSLPPSISIEQESAGNGPEF